MPSVHIAQMQMIEEQEQEDSAGKDNLSENGIGHHLVVLLPYLRELQYMQTIIVD